MGKLAAQEKSEWNWEQHSLPKPCRPDLPYNAGGWFIYPSSLQPLTGEWLVHSDSQGMNSGSQKTNEG